MASCAALSTITFLFFEDTLWAISAQYDLLETQCAGLGSGSTESQGKALRSHPTMGEQLELSCQQYSDTAEHGGITAGALNHNCHPSPSLTHLA